MSAFDPLTGLLNRIETLDEIDELILEEGLESITVVLLDIGRFRNVNDSVGIQVGDRIIKLIAKRIEKAAPDARVIGRTSGDNFALVFKSIDEENLRATLARLVDFSKRPIAVAGNIIVVSLSLGVAICSSNDGQDAASLFHAADVALHYAQNNGLEIAQFQSEMLDAAKATHAVENDLRVAIITHTPELHRAIANQQFSIYYQPIVSISDFSIVGFEALLRWKHPERGFISPDRFIPVAEEIGVIDLLGSWVLRRSCTNLSQWQAFSPETELFVSVNISAKQLKYPNLIARTIQQSLQESGLGSHCLHLEVTETSTFNQDPEVLYKIKELGCQLSLDDFGTGYSSLTYLHSLPFDHVKLDKSFVSKLDASNEEHRLVSEKMLRAVVGLCDAIDLNLIIEGIETQAQLNFVNHLGCPMCQGYFLGKPVPEEQIPDLLLAV